MRSQLIAAAFFLLPLCCTATLAQSAEQPQTTTLVGTTSVSMVAKPDDKVVVNGRIVTVSEVMAVASSGDSSLELRLHNPVTQNREELKQGGQSPQQDQSVPLGPRSAGNPSSAEKPSVVPGPDAKHPQ